MKRLILLLFILTSTYSFGQVHTGVTNGGKHFQSESATKSNDSRFGFAMDVSDDDKTLVIGAFSDDYDSLGVSRPNTGSLSIYIKNEEGKWRFHQKIYSSVLHAQGNFGYSLKLNGDYLFVSHTMYSLYGAVDIFKRNEEGIWEHLQLIESPDNNRRFGSRVTAYGNTMATGNVQDIYIYQLNELTGLWDEKQVVPLPVPAQWNIITRNVLSLSADDLIFDSHADNNIYIYQKNIADTWVLTQSISKDRNDKRTTLDLEGNQFIISNYDYTLNNPNHDDDYGIINIYEKNQEDIWEHKQKLDLPDNLRSKTYGYGDFVQIRGDYVLVGSPADYQNPTPLLNGYRAFVPDILVYRKVNETWNYHQTLVYENGDDIYSNPHTVKLTENAIYLGDDSDGIHEFKAKNIDRWAYKSLQCETIEWHGKAITEVGRYTETLTVDGKDYIDELVVLDLPDVINKQELTIYEASYDFNGKLLTQSGVYIDTLQNQFGCDSIAHLTILFVQDIGAGQNCESALPLGEGTYLMKQEYGTGWFSFTAPSDGDLTVSTCGMTEEDTQITFYSSCENQISSSDDADCADYLESHLTQTINKGETIIIKMDDYDDEEIDYPFEVSFDGEDIIIVNEHQTKSGFVCDGLTINAGQVLTITDGTLDVKGELNNNGTLVINSGASLMTYAKHGFKGEVIVKRNTRFANGQYSFVGTPVNQSSSIKGSLLGRSVYKYNESIDYGNNEGLLRWQKAKNDELIPGKGYTQAYKKEVVFKGRPNDGTITYTATYTDNGDISTDGWALVSNPYPTAISVSAFLAGNPNIDGALYLWDDNGSNKERGSNADYIVVNALGMKTNSRKGKGARFNSHLGATQGFFVRVSNAVSSKAITFTESMRIGGKNGDDNFFRKAGEDIKQTLKLSLQSGDDELFYAETLLGFMSDATEGVDRIYDALQLSGSDLQLYSLIDNQSYAIQGLPLVESEQLIPLGMDVAEAGNYTISIKDLKNIADDMVIQLVDTNDNTIHNLSETAYNFTAESSVNSHRFYLKVGKHEVINSLDIETTTFEVKLNGIYLPNIQKHHIQILGLTGKVLLDKMGSGFEGFNFKKNQLYIIKVDEAVKKISFR